jgi:LAO/AO transport system kinase
MSVLDRFNQGDIRALSRIISFVEDQEEGFRELLTRLYTRNGKSLRIGVTGPPGAWKSTLVNCLAQRLLAQGKTVGIIAVDPTSPFTGGALLGDRVRMNEFPSDGKFFFRSMATRGASGGLTSATDNITVVYDAFGFDVTLIETVGVGQVELDIIDTCDSIVVVMVPESGDSVQTMKAGLMEIADIFCVNKADRPASERIVSELRQALKTRKRVDDDWSIPVMTTEALNNKGIDELHEAIDEHQAFMQERSRFAARRRNQIKKKMHRILQARLTSLMDAQLSSLANIDEVVAEIYEGKTDPYTASKELIELSLARLSKAGLS